MSPCLWRNLRIIVSPSIQRVLMCYTKIGFPILESFPIPSNNCTFLCKLTRKDFVFLRLFRKQVSKYKRNCERAQDRKHVLISRPEVIVNLCRIALADNNSLWLWNATHIGTWLRFDNASQNVPVSGSGIDGPLCWRHFWGVWNTNKRILQSKNSQLLCTGCLRFLILHSSIFPFKMYFIFL